MELGNLSIDEIRQVARYMSYPHISRLCATSTRIRSICADTPGNQELWHHLTLRDFRPPYYDQIPHLTGPGWFFTYRLHWDRLWYSNGASYLARGVDGEVYVWDPDAMSDLDVMFRYEVYPPLVEHGVQYASDEQLIIKDTSRPIRPFLEEAYVIAPFEPPRPLKVNEIHNPAGLSIDDIINGLSKLLDQKYPNDLPPRRGNVAKTVYDVLVWDDPESPAIDGFRLTTFNGRPAFSPSITDAEIYDDQEPEIMGSPRGDLYW